MNFQKFKQEWQKQLFADRRPERGPKPREGLTTAALAVGFAISCHLNHKTREAWPGITTLSREAKASRKTVIRAIALLEARKHLRVIRTPRGVNHYHPTLVTPGSVKSVGLGSVTTMGLGSVKSVTPEPLIEPLSEPLIEPLPNGRDLPSRHTQTTKSVEEKRLSEEDSHPHSSATKMETCYREARRRWGQKGADVVGLADKNGMSADEILEEIFGVAEDDGEASDLAYATWRP